ncbi:MAG TPA: GapR family DNA-binding domain-containing protein, partial [Vitreimonas sp.]|nr:GapR family DNA-binding domain-containing protein [Vitreimonas sp.]
YAEAKAMGFDTKVLRQVIRLRKQDRQEREEQEQVRDLYLHALGEI